MSIEASITLANPIERASVREEKEFAHGNRSARAFSMSWMNLRAPGVRSVRVMDSRSSVNDRAYADLGVRPGSWIRFS